MLILTCFGQQNSVEIFAIKCDSSKKQLLAGHLLHVLSQQPLPAVSSAVQKAKLGDTTTCSKRRIEDGHQLSPGKGCHTCLAVELNRPLIEKYESEIEQSPSPHTTNSCRWRTTAYEEAE